MESTLHFYARNLHGLSHARMAALIESSNVKGIHTHTYAHQSMIKFLKNKDDLGIMGQNDWEILEEHFAPYFLVRHITKIMKRLPTTNGHSPDTARPITSLTSG